VFIVHFVRFAFRVFIAKIAYDLHVDLSCFVAQASLYSSLARTRSVATLHSAQNAQLDPAQVRRSARIAAHRARTLQQPLDDEESTDSSKQDVPAQQADSDMQ